MASLFCVLVQPPALDDMRRAYAWWSERDPARADDWLTGLKDAIQSLTTLPARCPIAVIESKAVNKEIRQLFYGKGRSAYRVYFLIEGSEVHVLHVRHHSQRPLKRQEILR